MASKWESRTFFFLWVFLPMTALILYAVQKGDVGLFVFHLASLLSAALIFFGRIVQEV